MTLKQFIQEQEVAFLLNLFNETGSVVKAAKQAGISVNKFYKHFPRGLLQTCRCRLYRERLAEAARRKAEKKRNKLVAAIHKAQARTELMLNRSAESPDTVRVEQLLELFGVVVDYGHGNRFWEHYAGRLDVLYFDARKGYLAMVRRLHPDSGNGDSMRMAQVNAAWERLETAFKKHGWSG